jgi:hypothetical protein
MTVSESGNESPDFMLIRHSCPSRASRVLLDTIFSLLEY